ncbi:ABC transporter ATP-binding protein [Marinobacterium sediminicola]|uniref:ABC transport system ATP-binding protein n=1 Tax=Marinobacterium sediminicola TaxID=518898 RepID=A0ABY1RXB2_9GAMM|nr:ABC transporter ATP-binding protein [Marinobacterium sediminicola]ULG67778.1 ABC transporter ATP-binding protein [Marinobacterium sediminicola]SMR71568.1 putative ABC transport system ATP-binding protein [Marinobacterium sediminicola]
MIRCEHLKVTFNAGQATEKRALRGVNLTIPQGEFVTVIGSNGAGKSTLLNTIAGDIRSSSGRLHFDDRDVTSLSAAARTRDVARVFQDPLAGTCGDMTIEENMALAYGRGQKGGLRLALNEGLRKLFREQLSRLNLGLEDRLDAKMGLLSGGQRQSVSLLMSALQPSKILLLDEHTAALDPKTAALVMDITDQIVAEKKLTVLMVTHSMRQALDHGTRTIMMHEGQVAFDLQGDERSNYGVKDLLNLFAQIRPDGEELDDDKLLLGT